MSIFSRPVSYLIQHTHLNNVIIMTEESAHKNAINASSLKHSDTQVSVHLNPVTTGRGDIKTWPTVGMDHRHFDFFCSALYQLGNLLPPLNNNQVFKYIYNNLHMYLPLSPFICTHPHLTGQGNWFYHI